MLCFDILSLFMTILMLFFNLFFILLVCLYYVEHLGIFKYYDTIQPHLHPRQANLLPLQLVDWQIRPTTLPIMAAIPPILPLQQPAPNPRSCRMDISSCFAGSRLEIDIQVCMMIGRIWVMEESNNKKYFRRYVKVGFVGPVAGLSLLCAGVTLYLITEEWTRMALGKGLVACVIGVGCYWGYRKLNLGRYWKSGRGVYKRLR